MARTPQTPAKGSAPVPKAKKGGLATKSARGSTAVGAKLKAAIQKKYDEIRATRPKITKGITVDDLMNLYFLPEVKHELAKFGISQTGNKRILCHRVAAWVNEGRRLHKSQTYRPAGQAPKPKAKRGRSTRTKPTSKMVDTTGLTSAPQATPVVATPVAVFVIPTPTATTAAKSPRKPAATSSQRQQAAGASHRHEHKWQYEDKTKPNGPWFDYDHTASDLVEEAYIDWKKDPFVDVRAVKSGEWEYMVDFNQMEQQNVKHTAHTRRKVRRVTVKDSTLADTEANEIRQRVLQQRQAAAGRK